MSNTPVVPDPNAVTDISIPTDIAPSAISTSTKGLAADVKLPERQVNATGLMTGFDPVKASQDGLLTGPTNLSPSLAPSARVRELGGPVTFGYVGQNLINSRGVMARPQYDASGEAYSELARLNTSDRLGFLSTLATRGLYGKKGKPSATGFDSSDISAMSEFLRFANSQGVTVDVAYNQFLAQIKPIQGTGKVVRPDAKQDLDSAVDSVFRQFMARDATPEEKAAFRQMAFKQKSAEAYGGAMAPNIGVAAQAYASNQFGPEAQATSAASLFDILDKKVKGLA
jgi:hypothetical protein